MKHDLKMAQKFLDALGKDGTFTFQTFGEKNSKSPTLASVFHGTLKQHQDALIKLNLQGAGIFVMVNEGDGITKPGQKTCRTKSNVVKVRAVFVDLDGAPIQPVLDATPLPDILVESSPDRWHAYWRVNECLLEDFKAAQQGLAAKFDGDRVVNDLSRVMRLPGFYRQKAEPVMTILHSTEGELK